MAGFTTKMMRLILTTAAMAVALPALAQDYSLLNYTGADRQQKLIAAAKKEGTFMLYTSLAANDYQELVAPFEKKYGIKVKLWRASSLNVLQRTVSEATAKRYEVDGIFTDFMKLEALHREKLLRPVYSPWQQELIPSALPAHREWAASILSVWTQAYNTNLVKKEDVPKTYQDLLDPKWKGKLAIEGKIPEWYATVVIDMGEENGLKFFKSLVAGNGMQVRNGLSVLNNLTVAGEVPLALTVFHYMPIGSKRDGAPIEPFVIEPAIARANGMGIARRAQNPNAALLFYDYLLTPEVQKLMAGLDYVPTNSKVASPLGNMRIKLVDPVQMLDQLEKWSASYDEVVLKGAKR
jgi:iron(III) transport system substrate-binding protein